MNKPSKADLQKAGMIIQAMRQAVSQESWPKILANEIMSARFEGAKMMQTEMTKYFVSNVPGAKRTCWELSEILDGISFFEVKKVVSND